MRNLIKRTGRISPVTEPTQQDSGGSMMRDMIIDNISRDGTNTKRIQ